jgi:predicted GNAT family N-acyltransferase
VLRGGGLGQVALQSLVKAASSRGDGEVLLHAQVSAVAFYLKQGFVARGDAFVEAGIEHQEMALYLR